MRKATGESAIWRARYALPTPAVEFLIAELDSLGTLGVEERASGPGEVLVLAYFAAPQADPAAWERAARVDPRARWLGCEPMPPADWERAWRAGLEPRCIAGLWVRPSWCATRGAPEIVIDPEQAFGTGEHATTRLALELLLEALRPGDAVLDLGCGSGILGLAALRGGAGWALGLDVDPVACANAAGNCRRNQLPLELCCGTLSALAPAARFDVVVANLLWSQLEPCLSRLLELARRTLVLSGWLEGQRPALQARLPVEGWRHEAERNEVQGGDRWCALRLHRSLQS